MNSLGNEKKRFKFLKNRTEKNPHEMQKKLMIFKRNADLILMKDSFFMTLKAENLSGGKVSNVD